MDKDLVQLLFDTNAFKVAPENEPFWYASGKLGPYFINVDYFYGSKEDAQTISNEIDQILSEYKKEEAPFYLCEKIMEQYDNNEMYKKIIDKLVEYIENNFETNLIDYISGGEKRDWLFSIPVANLLGKPHITIYEDKTTVASTSDFEESTIIEYLLGKRIFHISDILIAGANFEQTWVPAINNLGAKINWALFPVDMNQKGEEKLNEIGVKAYSLLKISEELFNVAIRYNVISLPQYELLCNYIKDPDGTMRKFISSHPTFVDDTINNSQNPKIIERAKICKEKNY